MKKIFFLIFTIFSLLSVGQESFLADDFTILKSNFIEPKSGLEVLGMIDDKVYVIKSSKADSLVIYNANSLKKLAAHPINITLNYGQADFYIVQSVLIKDKFHIFFKGYDRKAKTLMLVSKTYNLDGTALEEKIIIRTKTDSPLRKVDIEFLFTEDKQHFALRFYNTYNAAKKFVIEITWFDFDLNVVNTAALETGLLSNDANFHTETVSNKMHYACVVGNKNNPYEEIKLYVSYPKGGVVKNKLSIVDKDILIGGLGYNALNEELILSGFLGEKGKNKSKLQGYFYRIYDLKDASIKHEKLGNISREMFKEFKDNKNFTESRATGNSINFKHNNTIVMPNGDVFIIYDEYSLITVSSSAGVSTTLNLNDIFIIHFNQNYQLKYIDIIEREHTVSSYKHINMLYKVINGNTINLYFKQSVSKTKWLLANQEDFKKTKSWAGMAVIEVSISADGVSSRPIFAFPVNKMGGISLSNIKLADKKYHWFFIGNNYRKYPFIYSLKKTE